MTMQGMSGSFILRKRQRLAKKLVYILNLKLFMLCDLMKRKKNSISDSKVMKRITMQTKSRNIYLVPYVLWILLFVVAPIVLVVYYSFFNIDNDLTLENYKKFFTPVYLQMTLSSFWYAFLITLFSLVFSYPTAYLLTKLKHKQLWLLLIILPSWINLLLKAYAFFGIFGTYGTVNKFTEFLGLGTHQILFTDFSFVFVSVYIFIPFMILPIFNSLEELNPSLIYASR